MLSSGEWLWFIGLIFQLLPTPLSFDALGEGFSSSYRVGMRKLEWLDCSLMKVAWWSTWSFGHNASMWQPHYHSNCCTNAVRCAAETDILLRCGLSCSFEIRFWKYSEVKWLRGPTYQRSRPRYEQEGWSWQVIVPDTQKKLLPTLCCGYQIGVAEEGDARLAPSSTL